MRRRFGIAAPFLALGLIAWDTTLAPGVMRSGRIAISPDFGVAGEYGSWVVTYELGDIPIRTGGGIRVQLPEIFHAGPRNSATRIQGTAPVEPNYVSTSSTRAGVELVTEVELQSADVLVKRVKPSDMTRRAGYYVYVVRATVLKGELQRGDAISVTYGDMSRGSKGMRSGIVSGTGRVVAAIDTGGRGIFRLHADSPSFAIRAGPPVELLATARSQVRMGEAASLRIALLDQYANPCSGFAGRLTVRCDGCEAAHPRDIGLPAGTGWTALAFTPKRAGILRFEVAEASRALRGRSNPIEASASPPGDVLYWGDLHSHTAFSVQDAVGPAEDAYRYARHVSALDFYAVTDHSQPAGDVATGLSPKDWPSYTALTDRHNEPGAFATLHAYEASFGSPYGHHNVYFRNSPGPLLNPKDSSLPDLWRALRAGEALTIPHHTMKMPEVVDWESADDAELRRNFEIYSGHGLSEEYDPSHPLAFEQSLFTNVSTTTKTGASAQQAWAVGLRLSTIASSDDHRAHPGQPQYGLAAVRASTLTREGIFDGLFRRRTYGTTGARIILNFAIDGVEMGGELSPRKSEIAIHVRAVGTAPIDYIEVLRHESGKSGFQVIRRYEPAAGEATLDFRSPAPAPGGVYYVRLAQRGLVRERPAMAWSSPIWVSGRDRR